jgi:hypothetical protein
MLDGDRCIDFSLTYSSPLVIIKVTIFPILIGYMKSLPDYKIAKTINDFYLLRGIIDKDLIFSSTFI